MSDVTKTAADRTVAASAADDTAARVAASKKAIDDKAAADKKAIDDKATADKAAADRAVEDQKTKADVLAKTPVEVSGDAKLGGPFSIRGEGFGGGKGSLTIGGAVINNITHWSDVSIKGTLPPGTSGDVVLTTSFGVRKGVFPHPRAAAVTTVTTTIVGAVPTTTVTTNAKDASGKDSSASAKT